MRTNIWVPGMPFKKQIQIENAKICNYMFSIEQDLFCSPCFVFQLSNKIPLHMFHCIDLVKKAFPLSKVRRQNVKFYCTFFLFRKFVGKMWNFIVHFVSNPLNAIFLSWHQLCHIFDRICTTLHFFERILHYRFSWYVHLMDSILHTMRSRIRDPGR